MTAKASEFSFVNHQHVSFSVIREPQMIQVTIIDQQPELFFQHRTITELQEDFRSPVYLLIKLPFGNFFKPLVKPTHTHAHTQILEEKSATSAKFQLGTNFYGQLINLLKRGVDNENPPEPLTTVCTAIIKRINAVNLYYCSQNKNPYFNHSLFNS